jgi:hypothetical protein
VPQLTVFYSTTDERRERDTEHPLPLTCAKGPRPLFLPG